MPEIPLSNNDMERAFRLPAILKRVKLITSLLDFIITKIVDCSLDVND